MPYCSKCGHNIPANVRFCTACGAPVNGNGQNNLNNQSAQNPQSGQSYQNPQNTQNLPPQPPAAPAAPQMAVPPPPPPAPSAAPTSPLPPPTPGSQPGSYRVQMMRYKEASQPPQYSTTPPASYVQQQQAQRRQSSHRSSGSSSGGCFRRGFHILTAAIAMIASLSWGIRSAFPNLNFGNMGSIFNVFSSCTGGNQGGGLLGGLLGNNNGGLFGGLLDGGKSSGGETSDDAPSAKGYERVFTDAEMTDIFEAGFPQTDEDHGVCFGVFESEQQMQGKNVAFELKKASPGEDKRLVGKFVLILNGKVEQEGYLCYCGHSIYSLFDNIEDIDHASNASGIWYVSADGKSLSIYDNGEEKMKWTLKE